MAIAQNWPGIRSGKPTCCAGRWSRKKESSTRYAGFGPGMKDNGYSAPRSRRSGTSCSLSDYAFNRAHSAAYGVVSYWTAYLQANYRPSNMAAVLTSVRATRTRPPSTWPIRRMGITVLAPDVNESVRNFAPVGNRHSGSPRRDPQRRGQRRRRDLRGPQEKGLFTDFSDFLRKVARWSATRRSIESLIKSVPSTRSAPAQGPAAGACRRDRQRHEHQEGRLDGPVRLFGRWTHRTVPRARLGVRRQGARRRVGLQAPSGSGAVDARALRLRSPAARRGAGAVREVRHGHRHHSRRHRALRHQITIGGILTGVNRRVNRTASRGRRAAGGPGRRLSRCCSSRSATSGRRRVAEDAIVLIKARGDRRDDRSVDRQRPAVPDLSAGDRSAGGAGAGEHAHRAVARRSGCHG